ncbi:unnamed protein product [Rotaria sordida]|uniref:Uncharacterized protein n=1 Tax=Rotaria sordida TaxID=392033 RepID=A0A814AMW4_9BILA
MGTNCTVFCFLHDEFSQAKLKLWKLDENNCQCVWFKQNPMCTLLQPFASECGVARGLNGSFSTISPHRIGGNIDMKYLTKRAKLYLVL